MAPPAKKAVPWAHACDRRAPQCELSLHFSRRFASGPPDPPRAFPEADTARPSNRAGAAQSGKGRKTTSFFFRALRSLTSPPEAMANARRSSQLFRNAQQLRLTQARYAEARRPQDGEGEGNADERFDFLEVFTFEADIEGSMSWYVSNDELRSMEHLLQGSGKGAKNSQRNKRWFGEPEQVAKWKVRARSA